MQVKTIEDLSNLDAGQLNQVDPETLSLGTGLQDCIVIASAFERGAHSTPSESAVFATLSRNLQNTKQFSNSVVSSMSTYLKTPEETNLTGSDFLSLQSLNIGDEKQSTLDRNFSNQLFKFARDCIPCDLRLAVYLEFHPSVNLLGILEADLQAKIQFFSDVAELLNNVDVYGDFCDFLNLLSFMCIPDLQRIIATLMALFILEIPKFDGLVGLLQILIAPIFAPILNGLVSLLDQFKVLVTDPLDCVIDAIAEQLRKFGFQLDAASPIQQASDQLTSSLENFGRQLNGGLAELQEFLNEAKQTIEEKLDFYLDQVKALVGEIGAGDTAYLQASFKKLKIRLIRRISVT